MRFYAVLAALGICAVAYAQTKIFSKEEAANKTRACVPATGAAEEITSTASASDASAQMTANTVYMINCIEEAYLEWGTSAPTAASGDMIWPADTPLFFATDRNTLFVAARNVATDGSCWLLECK